VRDDTLCFAFRGRDLLITRNGPDAEVPGGAVFSALGLPVVRENEIGLHEGRPVVAVELAKDAVAPPGMAFENLRALFFTGLDERLYALAGRAVQIVDWDRNHQFCSRCAGPVERVEGENAKRCPACKLTTYPRLSPAVIVLVEREDTILLGKNARFPMPMYSTLAGFVEPGETLEETVHREIREEAGIEVTNIRYFGSQPWPFPDSLMIAFVADYAGGELKPDPSELADAKWFRLEELPMVPPRISIARALIDAWVKRRGGDPEKLLSVGR
jgi:NAD+ diphosphatase